MTEREVAAPGSREDAADERLLLALVLSIVLHALLAASLDLRTAGISTGRPPSMSANAPLLRAVLRGADVSGEIPDTRVSGSTGSPPTERGEKGTAAVKSPDSGKTANGSPDRPVQPPTVEPFTTSVQTTTMLPAPRYFQLGDVDIRPWIKMQVEPDYPEPAMRIGLSGKVMVRLYINEYGVVERARIESANPPGYFEVSVEKAFVGARYTPGMKNGQPVKVQILVEVTFSSLAPPRIVVQ